MIPLRDDLPGGGPPAGALLLVLAMPAAGLATGGSQLWASLACALGMYIFAPSLVRDIGTPATFAIAAAGALCLSAIASLAGLDAQAWIAPGASGATAVAHLVRYRRARVLGLLVLPAASRVVSTPTPSFAVIWGTAAIALVATGA